jgi:outer membrane autotransporter protein
MKAVGSWTNRSDTQNFAIAGTAFPVDLGHKQNVYGAIGGFDFGREAVLARNDVVALGLMGGYVNSGLDFGASPTTFRFSGGTAGASATYLNGGFFVDALAKVDFLRLDIEGLPAGAGAPGAAADAVTFGAIGNVGYRIEWQRLFVEPLATLAYTRTKITDIGLPVAGVTVSFTDAETVRGALGARFGARVAETAGWGLDASIVARVWDQFRGNNGATIANAGFPLLLTDTFTGTFGEVTGHLDLVARGTGFSAFVAGGAKFNRDFTTTNAKGGIRYQF